MKALDRENKDLPGVEKGRETAKVCLSCVCLCENRDPSSSIYLYGCVSFLLLRKE
ncbi:hypothetical protein SLEP1_g14849 [Rubroshorea leprosula]|uniref:Uncharacterized protein n=1 Tax=Rubroshorea leprosula TaxID=152421 RepID=A0AAV5IUI6_9ROSI|nr:hypothetical protein SLEP1_g14849 [Rubroshorea leprosula]